MRMCFFLAGLTCLQAFGQIALKVEGKPSVTITAEEFSKLPRHAVVLHDHGKDRNYEGVSVHDLLAHVGVDFGKGLHGRQLATYVTVLATDGYRAVFSLADFDPTVSDSVIVIADRHNGKPLGEKEGAFRLVVPQDKRPARSVRLFKEIDVVQPAPER